MPAPRSRLVLLLALAGAGAAVGVVGHLASGSQLWYLALPAVLAAGWLVVADPTRCEARPDAAADPRAAEGTDEGADEGARTLRAR